MISSKIEKNIVVPIFLVNFVTSIDLVKSIKPIALVDLVELVEPVAPTDQIELVKLVGLVGLISPKNWFSISKLKLSMRLALSKVYVLGFVVDP